MHPSERQWSEFYTKVYNKTRLDLRQYKPTQLQRRILNMVSLRNVGTLENFGSLVTGKSEEMQWFLDKMAINVSEFFRNPERWAELRDLVIPELMARNRGIKAWSAGCSFGAEAYTLAILLEEYARGGRHSILGTDIDKTALDQAKRGDFSKQDLRSVPPELIKKYFDQKEDRFYANSRLIPYLSFKHGNLLRDIHENSFDLIMCRNVVIYFTDEVKANLYRKFFKALKPGGILFVGSTERIFDAVDIGYELYRPFFYRKPLEETTQWRNAS